ncbi:protein FAM246C-like [Elephas maximus indicus]|uniref:protein FAM246C-like n=1 Tax=Elephas maximus indicus TaxID=99487 RepID=UPI002116F0A1|nr:protein FAM246C-like [Elephas maximus indicus]
MAAAASGVRQAVGPLRAAGRSWAVRRTRRRLARRDSRLRAPAAAPAAPAPDAARRPCCTPSRGRRSPARPAAASHFLPAFPFFGRKLFPWPCARRANSSALPPPGSRSPRKSQLSSRRAPCFLIKSR